MPINNFSQNPKFEKIFEKFRIPALVVITAAMIAIIIGSQFVSFVSSLDMPRLPLVSFFSQECKSDSPDPEVLSLNSRGSTVREVETLVATKLNHHHEINDQYDYQTCGLIKKWQKAHDLSPTGVVDQATLDSLRGASSSTPPTLAPQLADTL